MTILKIHFEKWSYKNHLGLKKHLDSSIFILWIKVNNILFTNKKIESDKKTEGRKSSDSMKRGQAMRGGEQVRKEKIMRE